MDSAKDILLKTSDSFSGFQKKNLCLSFFIANMKTF